MQKIPSKIILTLAVFLILDPLLRLMSFKISTGMEWTLVWDNIIRNGDVSAMRFIEFWLLAPMAGLFLLTLSRVACIFYAGLTLYKFYSLVSYTPYDWPYFAAKPHFGALVIFTFNALFVLLLFWPILRKYILSYYLKDIWDARGRYECQLSSTLFINGAKSSFRGFVKNISSGGVLFNLYEGNAKDLKVDDHGLIVMELKNGEFLSLEIRLVNVTISNRSDLFGMEFEYVDPQKSLILMNLLLELRTHKKNQEKTKALQESA